MAANQVRDDPEAWSRVVDQGMAYLDKKYPDRFIRGESCIVDAVTCKRIVMVDGIKWEER